MKKIFCFCFVIFNLQFAIFNYCSAKRFKAGLTGGLTVTDVGSDDPVDHDNDFHKVGYVLGGFVNTPISDKGILQFELNVIQKGTLQNPDSNNMNYYKLVLNYVEIPILYKHHLTIFSSKRPVNAFDIHAGLSIGQLVHSTIAGDSVSQNPDMSFLNKTDVSILAGINYNFSENFNFCLRYSNSLIPVVKRNSISAQYYLPPNSVFNNGNNMVWHFMFQYTFGGGKNSGRKDDSKV